MDEKTNSYHITTSENSGTCYLKFNSELERTDQAELEALEQLLKDQSEVIINYIFDLSELSFIDHKSYRPLAMAQHYCRNKKDSIVVVVAPSLEVKKILLEAGLIRPKEICLRLDKVGDFIHYVRSKITKN